MLIQPTEAAAEVLFKTRAGYEAVMAWYDEALRSLPVPVESRYVPTRFGDTHMLVTGPVDAPPLIMVQGYGASAPLWKTQYPALAPHFRIYALDAPGQPGRSAPNPPSLFNDEYALWLRDVQDALGLAQTHLMGVCFGGWIVMRYAAFAPQRLSRLVILSPVGLARLKIYWRSGVPLVLGRGDTYEKGKRLLKMAFAPPNSGVTLNPEVNKALSLVVRHYNVGALAQVGLNGAPLDRPALVRAVRALKKFVLAEPPALLRRITTPTLLMMGEHEGIFETRHALHKAQFITGLVAAEVVPATGHAAIYDRPDVVNARVLAFLQSGR